MNQVEEIGVKVGTKGSFSSDERQEQVNQR